jgi:hypothetical protein
MKLGIFLIGASIKQYFLDTARDILRSRMAAKLKRLGRFKA